MKTSRLSVAGSAIVIWASLASDGRGAIVELLAGTPDAFAAPPESAAPSQYFAAAYTAETGQLNKDFDAFISNRGILHTFTNLPEHIIDGELEFRIRANNDPSTYTDVVTIAFVEASDTYYSEGVVWSRYIRELTGELGIGSGWSPGDDKVLHLSLSALPLRDGTTISLIPFLNTHDFLDVGITEDTAVDYLRLTLRTGPLAAATVPEPSVFLGWQCFIVGATCSALWRRRNRPPQQNLWVNFGSGKSPRL